MMISPCSNIERYTAPVLDEEALACITNEDKDKALAFANLMLMPEELYDEDRDIWRPHMIMQTDGTFYITSLNINTHQCAVVRGAVRLDAEECGDEPVDVEHWMGGAELEYDCDDLAKYVPSTLHGWLYMLDMDGVYCISCNTGVVEKKPARIFDLDHYINTTVHPLVQDYPVQHMCLSMGENYLAVFVHNELFVLDVHDANRIRVLAGYGFHRGHSVYVHHGKVDYNLPVWVANDTLEFREAHHSNKEEQTWTVNMRAVLAISVIVGQTHDYTSYYTSKHGALLDMTPFAQLQQSTKIAV